MISYVIDESHLRALTPSARRELLRLIHGDLEELKERLADVEWHADRGESYPLSTEQAAAVLRTQNLAVKKALRVFVEHTDGTTGSASLAELIEATGYDDPEQISQDFGMLTGSLRAITGDNQAWIINWDAETWEWSEADQRYLKGEYFINGPAIAALEQAFGEDPDLT